MARLPDSGDLGSRPVPVSRRGVSSNPAAGAVGYAAAGVGNELAQVGEGQLREQKQKADATRFALAGTAVLKASNDTLAGFDTDQDYTTFEQRYRSGMQTATEAASKIISPEDRALFTAQTGQDIERGAAQATRLSQSKASATEIAAVQETTLINRTLAVNAADPKDREQAIRMTGDAWNGLATKGYIDPATARTKQREFVNQVGFDVVDRDVAASDLKAAQEHLTQYAPMMDEKDVTRAAENIRIRQAGIDAEARRVAAEGRAEAAHQTAVVRDQLGAIEQGFNDGSGTVEDRMKLAQQYHAIGDESKAAEWVQKGTEFAAVQSTRGESLPQMDAQIAALVSKQGGKGLNAAEAAQLKGLQDQRAQSAMRLNQPGGALLQLQYATGKPVAPLDANNPTSFRQRASSAAAAAQTYGRAIVEPLLPEEVKPLQDLLAKGDIASRTQALRIITGFGSPAAIRGAAAQITGDGDGAFKVAATRSLGPAGSSVAMHILGGADALKANPGIWQAAKPDDPTKLIPAENAARAIFNEYIPALAGLGPDAARDTYDAAKDYYASKMTAAGKSQFNADTWRQAVDTVIGGYNQDGVGYRGGTAMFQGAHRVVIPEGWTGEGLFRRLARATGDDWAKAGGGQDPIWPDGSKVYSGQLSQLVPVWVGGTSYVFRSPKTGNFLGTRSGRPFRIDAAKVPWR